MLASFPSNGLEQISPLICPHRTAHRLCYETAHRFVMNAYCALAPKFLPVHRQQQCFSQISPFDLSRETSAFSSLIIALKSASPSANAVALPNQSVDLAAESFSPFCQESNRAVIPTSSDTNCHGAIFFRYANKPVRQPSPSLDSAFPRQSHSCLPNN
jgi:hypothetical protein